MSSQMLLVERQEGVCTLTLNRPQRRNALCPELIDDLSQQLSSLAEGTERYVLVLRGIGEQAFCSGHDLGELVRSDVDTPPEEPLLQLYQSIRSYPYPVIAMIHGYAIGGGLGLAMACDLRISADTGKFGMPQTRLGVIYPPIGLRDFINAIGLANTRHLFFTGRLINAQEAQRFGLVNEVVPAADLHDHVYALADTIASNAPLALKGTKTILNRLALPTELTPAEEETFAAMRLHSFRSRDRLEAMVAFKEHRSPIFSGE
ncbi:MAG: enoyl-CoA hydratase/isomerase family protein [Chloroflexota bacterium]|nr:MAG: enoyl-CoA hydratase/isomerase family protein [Chloroflexota bacterium]